MRKRTPAYFLTVRRAVSNGCLFLTAFNADLLGDPHRLRLRSSRAARAGRAAHRRHLLYDLEHWGDRYVIRTQCRRRGGLQA